MIGDDEITKQSFENFAGTVARNIAVRNASVKPTKVVAVVE